MAKRSACKNGKENSLGTIKTERMKIMNLLKLQRKHTHFCLQDKKMFIDYIERNKEKMVFIKPILYTIQENRTLEKVLLTHQAEKVYAFIGDFFSTKETPFKDIHYREDCYEYLVKLGYKPKIAIEIAEEIRKGIWSVRDSKLKKGVPKDFLKWAEGVKYLVSRDVIYEGFMIIEDLPSI